MVVSGRRATIIQPQDADVGYAWSSPPAAGKPDRALEALFDVANRQRAPCALLIWTVVREGHSWSGVEYQRPRERWRYLQRHPWVRRSVDGPIRLTNAGYLKVRASAYHPRRRSSRPHLHVFRVMEMFGARKHGGGSRGPRRETRTERKPLRYIESSAGADNFIFSILPPSLVWAIWN